MSSDEEEPTSPVLPKDSDPGSSVSSDLQDEYEELLRYAVVTPKLDRLTSAHLQQRSASHLSAEGRTQRKDDTTSLRPADFYEQLHSYGTLRQIELLINNLKKQGEQAVLSVCRLEGPLPAKTSPQAERTSSRPEKQQPEEVPSFTDNVNPHPTN